MDKQLAELISIEQAAKQSMMEFEDERAAHARNTAEEIVRRNLEIRRGADQELQRLKQEAEASTQAKLAKIEDDCQAKAAQLRHLFESNADKWRKQWANRVLQIES